MTAPKQPGVTRHDHHLEASRPSAGQVVALDALPGPTPGGPEPVVRSGPGIVLAAPTTALTPEGCVGAELIPVRGAHDRPCQGLHHVGVTYVVVRTISVHQVDVIELVVRTISVPHPRRPFRSPLDPDLVVQDGEWGWRYPTVLRGGIVTDPAEVDAIRARIELYSRPWWRRCSSRRPR